MIGSTMAKKPDEKKSVPDHRKIGQELDLSPPSDLVGSGFPLRTPRGTMVRQESSTASSGNALRAALREASTIPHITKKNYEKSGHWDNFRKTFFRITRARAANMR